MKYLLKNKLEIVGKQYLLGIGGYDGTNSSEALSVSEVIMPINTTYSELKELILNSKLIPGREYKFLFRSVVSSNYISDEQSFYLIVTAETENTLSSKAKAERDNAPQNNAESAFYNSKFSEWEIWYDIDNNTDKYDWAVEGGLGVIYRMIDEYGNDVYYDFKNIRRKRSDGNATYLFTQKGNSREDGSKFIFEIVDESIESSVLGYFINNKVKCYENLNINIDSEANKLYICSINIFHYNSANQNRLIKNNTIVIDCPIYHITGNDVVVGILGDNNYVSVAHGASDVLSGTFINGNNNKLNGVVICTVNGYDNTLGYSCSYINIKGDNNVFGNYCTDIKIISRDTGASRWAYFWKFGDRCQHLYFTSKSETNTIYNVNVTDCTGKADQSFEYQIEPNNSTSEITNIYLDRTNNVLKSYKDDRFGITLDDASEAAKCEGFGVITVDFANNEFYMSSPTDGEMIPLHLWMLNATVYQKRRGIGVHYVLENGLSGYTSSGNIFMDETKDGQPTLQFTAEGYTYTSVAGEDYLIKSFIKEKQLSGGGSIDITYQELVDIRAAKNLVAGAQYRITDYVTTTIQENTTSAGHMFDVIVTALDASTLSENAYAIQSARDTDGYFSKSNLAAWQIWYCLDNDSDRFAWAAPADGKYKRVALVKYNYSDYTAYRVSSNDTEVNGKKLYAWNQGGGPRQICYSDTLDITSDSKVYTSSGNEDTLASFLVEEKDSEKGKGVIYRMIDEMNNDLPYDFKNIKFKHLCVEKIQKFINTGIELPEYYYTFTYYDSSAEEWCESTVSKPKQILCNTIKEYINEINGGKLTLNNIIFIGLGITFNTFGKDCYNNTFMESIQNNTFGGIFHDNHFGVNVINNIFGNYCYNNEFHGAGFINNIFGNGCYNNKFVSYDEYIWMGFMYNTLGNYCFNNSFGSGFQSNILGNACNNIKVKYSCQYNTFGNGCSYINFGESEDNLTDYYCYITIDSGNQYINLNCTGTTSSANYYRNVRIGFGVNNTTTYKTITDSNVNQTVQTYYLPKSSTSIEVD